MKDLIEKVVAEDKLLLQNGKLFEKPRAPGMPGAEVLDTPEISVVAVIGGKPVGDSNESRFSFKLNHTVCPIWWPSAHRRHPRRPLSLGNGLRIGASMFSDIICQNYADGVFPGKVRSTCDP
jgi:hypothetical protein